MSAADRLEDGFPHGTVDGYRRGCKGGDCPAGEEIGLSCRRAKQLAAGDYRYQKLIRRGATPGQVADELGLMPEVHAAPAKKKHAVPYDEEDVPATVEDEPIEEEEPIMNTAEEVEAQTETPAAAKTTTPAKAPTHAEKVRAWCREHGIPVGDRGALPKKVLEAFEASDPSLAKPTPRKRPSTPKVEPTRSAADLLRDIRAAEGRELVEAEPEELVEAEPEEPTPALAEPIEDELAGIQEAVAAAEDEPITDDEAAEIAAMWSGWNVENIGGGSGFVTSCPDPAVAIAEHDRDVAQHALELVLLAWGREKHRADQLTEQLRLANGALRLSRALLQEDEDSASHEAAIIAHLDRQVSEQADEIARLRRPWWKRRAS